MKGRCFLPFLTLVTSQLHLVGARPCLACLGIDSGKGGCHWRARWGGMRVRGDERGASQKGLQTILRRFTVGNRAQEEVGRHASNWPKRSRVLRRGDQYLTAGNVLPLCPNEYSQCSWGEKGQRREAWHALRTTGGGAGLNAKGPGGSCS